jgi:HlyD family secretion protein
MPSIIKIISFSSLLAFTISCQSSDQDFDASGSFEAEETIISAQANGILNSFQIREGQNLKAGENVGEIDTFALHLKKEQISAQIEAVASRTPNKNLQIASLKSQLDYARTEKSRWSKLVAGGAASTKQLDDIESKISSLSKQLIALESSLNISINSIEQDIKQLEVQRRQIEDQLLKCKIINPLKGQVIASYAEQFEMTAAGKPLYKIADLSQIILRAYITGNQFPQVKLNKILSVYTDNGEGGFNETTGEVIWISDKAEFTPKTIQTKDERANMVYALKILVKNEGAFKIGMYGEIKFN